MYSIKHVNGSISRIQGFMQSGNLPIKGKAIFLIKYSFDYHFKRALQILHLFAWLSSKICHRHARSNHNQAEMPR